MDKSREVLEQGSVQKLVQISEECFSPVPKQANSPRLPFRCSKPRLIPLFRPAKSCIRPTPCLLPCPDLSPFHSYLSNFSPAYQCKCLFRGGSGFKGRNKDTPCASMLCINRVNDKFHWNSKRELSKKRGKMQENRLVRGVQGLSLPLLQSISVSIRSSRSGSERVS